jgi:hypothetical protein
MKCKDAISHEQLACLEAVQKINNRQHDTIGWETHVDLLSMQIQSYNFRVVFKIVSLDIEIVLHDSANDLRKHNRDGAVYEEWEPYLKRQLKERIVLLRTIKL